MDYEVFSLEGGNLGPRNVYFRKSYPLVMGPTRADSEKLVVGWHRATNGSHAGTHGNWDARRLRGLDSSNRSFGLPKSTQAPQ